MSRNFERQVNEVRTRAAIFNQFTELGRPLTAAVASHGWGLKKLATNWIYATAPHALNAWKMKISQLVREECM